jgi:hypothetical protein
VGLQKHRINSKITFFYRELVINRWTTQPQQNHRDTPEPWQIPSTTAGLPSGSLSSAMLILAAGHVAFKLAIYPIPKSLWHFSGYDAIEFNHPEMGVVYGFRVSHMWNLHC